MSYIGQGLPSNSFIGYTTDTFAGDGSATTFTMSKAPFNESAVIVVINNVVQQPTADFTVSGTTLTIDAAVASGDVIYATHTGGAIPINTASGLEATTTIGNGAAEDTKVVFDGNAQDFYIGLDDSADDLIIGLGSAVGTTPIISVDENKLTTVANGLTLTDGDVTVASGHGISFAATGDGSGTDSSELLDDYEEGTWTPSITAGFSAQNGYQTLHGRYIKTGSQVHVSFYYYTAASGWTSNGLAIQLGNLPYTQVNETGARGLGVVNYTTMAAHTPAIYGNPNSATVTLYRDGSTGFARGSDGTAGNSLYIIGGFSYEAA